MCGRMYVTAYDREKSVSFKENKLTYLPTYLEAVTN